MLGTGNISGPLALMLANGITGFRQMSGSADLLEERREHRLPLGSAAPALLTMPGEILTPMNASSPKAAIATIRKQKAEGADFIKVGLVDPATFCAAETEAHKLDLPFVGHMQQGVDAAAASQRGMRAIEHLGPGDTVLVSCSSDEQALRRTIADRPAAKLLSILSLLFTKASSRVALSQPARPRTSSRSGQRHFYHDFS